MAKGQEITQDMAAQAQQILQMYQQQQGGGQAAAGGKGKKKGKSLTDIVTGTVGKTTQTIKNAPLYKEKALTGIDGILGSFVRSAATSFAVVSTAAPLALISPVSAGLTALFAGGYAYVTSNTMYKLCRDSLHVMTYPILRPKKTVDMVLGKVFNPLQTVQMLLKTPFKLVGGIITYPFTAKRTKTITNAKGEAIYQNKNAGVNKVSSTLGSVLGGYGAIGSIYASPLESLKEYGSKVLGYGKGLIGNYVPNYALKPI